nr:MAG TPA: hypothetical protein [Caudoviricetes sp.]DAQ96771.1 MAG TPA: hypothetical protein [Caudoviricetes sp.]DAS21942.1 MAG TPA: hypothetical protein [Caudoviricetes sp.]
MSSSLSSYTLLAFVPAGYVVWRYTRDWLT